MRPERRRRNSLRRALQLSQNDLLAVARSKVETHQRQSMSNEITIAPTNEEIEKLKGHLPVVETALGKLVWCCARDARRHGDWLAAYLVALPTEHECWTDQPPLGEVGDA